MAKKPRKFKYTSREGMREIEDLESQRKTRFQAERGLPIRPVLTPWYKTPTGKASERNWERPVVTGKAQNMEEQLRRGEKQLGMIGYIDPQLLEKDAARMEELGYKFGDVVAGHTLTDPKKGKPREETEKEPEEATEPEGVVTQTAGNLEGFMTRAIKEAFAEWKKNEEERAKKGGKMVAKAEEEEEEE